MVKTNQRPITALVSKSSDSQIFFRNSSDVGANSGSPEEDSWVIVKKQKVNILIPRLPSSEQCRLPDLGLSQGQLNVDMPIATNLTSTPTQLPQQKPSDTCITERRDDVTPRSPEPDKVASNPGPEKMDLGAHNFQDQDDVVRTLCRKKRSHLKFHETAHKPSRDFGQPGQLRVNLPDCIAIVDKTMRASNVKMKISRAGGLHGWLSSLGLERFESVFRGKNISRFLLANLSMNKLKEMGYDAVGPRRKLIHAIECLCQSPVG